jgi:hypothetical protein
MLRSLRRRFFGYQLQLLVSVLGLDDYPNNTSIQTGFLAGGGCLAHCIGELQWPTT